jgi:hypothetical protein
MGGPSKVIADPHKRARIAGTRRGVTEIGCGGVGVGTHSRPQTPPDVAGAACTNALQHHANRPDDPRLQQKQFGCVMPAPRGRNASQKEEREKHKTKRSSAQGRCSPLLPVCMQSTPSREFFSLTCRDLMAARVSIGDRPEFSASAIGIASSASEKARIAYCSSPAV